MTNEITSKDYWYVGVAAAIGSMITENYIGAIGLLITSLMCIFFYMVSMLLEHIKERRERRLEFLRTIGDSLKGLLNLMLREILTEKPKPTPRRKTTRRRVNKK